MLSLIIEYRDEAQRLLAFIVCTSCLIWGGGPERALALIWLTLFELIQMGYFWTFGSAFGSAGLALAYMVIDSLATIMFGWIALQANRTYPLWIAAFQLVALLAHLSRALMPSISQLAYYILVVAPSYFQLGLLAGGLLVHIRRKRKVGPYRDWRRGAWSRPSLNHSLVGNKVQGKNLS